MLRIGSVVVATLLFVSMTSAGVLAIHGGATEDAWAGLTGPVSVGTTRTGEIAKVGTTLDLDRSPLESEGGSTAECIPQKEDDVGAAQFDASHLQTAFNPNVTVANISVDVEVCELANTGTINVTFGTDRDDDGIIEGERGLQLLDDDPGSHDHGVDQDLPSTRTDESVTDDQARTGISFGALSRGASSGVHEVQWAHDSPGLAGHGFDDFQVFVGTWLSDQNFPAPTGATFEGMVKIHVDADAHSTETDHDVVDKCGAGFTLPGDDCAALLEDQS